MENQFDKYIVVRVALDLKEFYLKLRQLLSSLESLKEEIFFLFPNMHLIFPIKLKTKAFIQTFICDTKCDFKV